MRSRVRDGIGSPLYGGSVASGAEDFYAHLPRRHLGAGVLITDEQDRVLLVQPTYKPNWEIPGGCVEAFESPPAAAHRECQEELGCVIDVGRLLVVEHQTIDGRDSTMFLYDAGRLPSSIELSLPPSELRSCRFVPEADLDELVVERLARRLRAALVARHDGTVVELVNGEQG